MPHTEALSDIRVVDTDTWACGNRSPMDVLISVEHEKRAKYGSVV